MKYFHYFLGLSLASVLAFSGCSKSEPPASVEANIQAIDATSFRPAFESASLQTKAIVDEVMMAIQDSAYPKALANLDKLTSLPDLTEAQKKAVDNLSGQLKKKMSQMEN